MSDASHPLVAGIQPFDADDELYLSEYHGSNHALLHTYFSGEAPGFTAKYWPGGTPEAGLETQGSDRQLVLYLHAHQGGEILYCTLGHCRGHYDLQPLLDWWPSVDRCAWDLPVFYDLLRRGVAWLKEPLGEAVGK